MEQAINKDPPFQGGFCYNKAMNIFILLAVGMLGVVAGTLLATRQRLRRIAALERHNQQASARKERRKEKILTLFRKKKRITNNEVEGLLGVSDATAIRYLQELEEAGRVRQRGKKRGVYYELP